MCFHFMSIKVPSFTIQLHSSPESWVLCPDVYDSIIFFEIFMHNHIQNVNLKWHWCFTRFKLVDSQPTVVIYYLEGVCTMNGCAQNMNGNSQIRINNNFTSKPYLFFQNTIPPFLPFFFPKAKAIKIALLNLIPVDGVVVVISSV